MNFNYTKNLLLLTEAERHTYYMDVCKGLQLNPLTKPFEFLKTKAKNGEVIMTLYAKKDASDQLRKLHNISIKITKREFIDTIYIVTAQASMPSGRTEEADGAVGIAKNIWKDKQIIGTQKMEGDELANAIMRCQTKATRRVTLSICGLGFTDETEIESIPNTETVELKNFNQTNQDKLKNKIIDNKIDKILNSINDPIDEEMGGVPQEIKEDKIKKLNLKLLEALTLNEIKKINEFWTRGYVEKRVNQSDFDKGLSLIESFQKTFFELDALAQRLSSINKEDQLNLLEEDWMLHFKDDEDNTIFIDGIFMIKDKKEHLRK